MELNHLKEDLQQCTAHYHRIRGINYLIKYLQYSEDNSINVEKCFNRQITHNETINNLRSIGWGLNKISSDQAAEFNGFFNQLIGDVSKQENFVDRQVV